MKFVKVFIQLTIVFTILIFSRSHAKVRFAVYSDCRAPKGDITKAYPYSLFNQDVLGFINSQVKALSPQPEFVMIIGDLVNRAFPEVPDLPAASTSNLNAWKNFMTSTESTGLGSIPIYVAVGNSDIYGTTWWTELTLQAEFNTFAKTFANNPSNGPTTPVDFSSLTYSFETGTDKDKSLFVVLDSFGIYGTGATATHCDNDFDPSGYTTEQITWFSNTINASSANHKFVFSHGPAFSSFGYTIGSNVAQIWDLAMANNFDTFFCAHEHIFRRWNKYTTNTPDPANALIQSLTGCAGAVPSSLSGIQNPEGRIYSGYNYVIVDVDGDKVSENAYKVESNGAGGYTSTPLDTAIIVK